MGDIRAKMSPSATTHLRTQKLWHRRRCLESPLQKGIVSVLGTLFFGLMPVWVLWLLTGVFVDPPSIMNQIVFGGAAIFCSMAVLGSVALDYLLAGTYRSSDSWELVIIVLAPIIMTAAGCTWYSSWYGRPAGALSIGSALRNQVVLLVLTLVYSTFVKAKQFMEVTR